MTAPSDRPQASQDEVPSRETSGEPLTGPVETQMAVQQWLLLDSRVVGFADVIQLNCCHPFLLEVLLFQWP